MSMVEACSQLLQLVVKNHPVVTAPEQQPKALVLSRSVFLFSRFCLSSLGKWIAEFGQ